MFMFFKKNSISDKSKLKIAIFHFAFIYSGGGEKLVMEEAVGLAKKGHRVDVYSSAYSSKLCFPGVYPVKIKTFLPQISTVLPEHDSFQILLTCVVAPFLAFKFRSYDVILAANQPSPWIAFWVRLFFKVPYVSYLAQPTRYIYPRKVDLEEGLIFSRKRLFSITAKLLEVSTPITSYFDKISIRKSGLVLSNGRYIKQLLDKTYDIKTINVPAGTHPAKQLRDFSKRADGTIKVGKTTIQKPFILITNRHFPQKRFEYALAAMPALLLLNPKIKLVITGSKTFYTDTLKIMIKELSLDDSVQFVGFVNEQELSNLYSNAYIYCYTAPEEDFGMGIIEAMGNGVPVVAWDNSGPKEIIENNKTGLLAHPLEIVDFTKKIELLLTNRKLAENISNLAYSCAVSDFSYKNHINLVEEALKKSITE